MKNKIDKSRGKSKILAGKALAGENHHKIKGFTSDKIPPSQPQKEYIFQHGESHMLTVAPTGAGKGRNQIITNSLLYDGQLVAIDVKGENAMITSAHRKKSGPTYLLDPFKVVTDKPDRFNPIDAFHLIRGNNVQKALQLTETLLVGYTGFKKDMFWDNWGNKVISGLLNYVINDPSNKEKTFSRLRKILSCDDVTYQLAVILDTEKEWMTTGTDKYYAYQEIAQFLQLPERETRPSVTATAQQHIQIFGDPDVIEATNETTLDLASFQQGEPMTIYIIIPPKYLQSHGKLLRIWIGTLLELTTERKVLPEKPTLFMIDEIAQLGRLEIFERAITLLRGYGVRVWSFWQDLSQIKHLYPDKWETIINNLEAFFTFGVTTPMMAKSLSDVIDAPYQDILNLPEDQMIMYTKGKLNYLQKVDYLTDKLFTNKFTPNPMYTCPSSSQTSSLELVS